MVQGNYFDNDQLARKVSAKGHNKKKFLLWL